MPVFPGVPCMFCVLGGSAVFMSVCSIFVCQVSVINVVCVCVRVRMCEASSVDPATTITRTNTCNTTQTRTIPGTPHTQCTTHAQQSYAQTSHTHTHANIHTRTYARIKHNTRFTPITIIRITNNTHTRAHTHTKNKHTYTHTHNTHISCYIHTHTPQREKHTHTSHKTQLTNTHNIIINSILRFLRCIRVQTHRKEHTAQCNITYTQ
jgi:hypothetical protein